MTQWTMPSVVSPGKVALGQRWRASSLPTDVSNGFKKLNLHTAIELVKTLFGRKWKNRSVLQMSWLLLYKTFVSEVEEADSLLAQSHRYRSDRQQDSARYQRGYSQMMGGELVRPFLTVIDIFQLTDRCTAYGVFDEYKNSRSQRRYRMWLSVHECLFQKKRKRKDDRLPPSWLWIVGPAMNRNGWGWNLILTSGSQLEWRAQACRVAIRENTCAITIDKSPNNDIGCTSVLWVVVSLSLFPFKVKDIIRTRFHLNLV